MSEYCLRWNNHRPNLVTVFSELLTSEALVDVTLATDGHYIHAHKLVLSACSVYFKDLFGANPCKHPIVILKDIRIDDLKTVIDFIYRGEVNVAQDRLQDVLKTAESLRIKGLAENPRNYDEIASHGTRLGSQVNRQRSSLTDSREQSLSLEGEEEGEPGTPPSSKRRKITSSHDSSESQLDEQENDNTNRLSEIKDEPSDERENDRSHSGDTEQESNVNRVADAMLMLQGASQESAEESGNNAGTSSEAAMASHSQGRGKRGVLQRQHGISGNAGTEERREEIPSLQVESIKCDVKKERCDVEKVPELIVPDTMVLSGGAVTLTNTQPTLLQVPTMVVGPRDSLGPSTLPKQHSNPTPLLAPTPIISKQSSHPEVRVPPKQQGPPPMMKQQSYPSVLTHAPSHSVERIPCTSSSSSAAAAGTSQHLQVIPMQTMQVFMKQRQLSTPPSVSSQLRPIQPKPPGENQIQSEQTPKKDIPLIRLTPSEDGAGFSGSSAYSVTGLTGPPRLPRAVSEEPAMTRPSMTHTPELLAPGPSTLVQSVSQDSGLDGGLGRRMPPIPQVAATAPAPLRQASAPGHCPVLRGGPALGCNYCWNSTDPQGRVLRRKTKYHCPECRTNLCIVPCFHEYHKQIEKAQDTDKQITKILTKTSSM